MLKGLAFNEVELLDYRLQMYKYVWSNSFNNMNSTCIVIMSISMSENIDFTPCKLQTATF